MKKMKTIMFIFLFVCATVQALAQNYLAEMDKALYLEYADIRMEVYKNDKLLKSYALEFYRKEAKMRMEFTEPAVEKGRRMLNDESNMWMYMPRTSKVVKLPFKQAFMGSDASNRDLMRLAFQEDYELVGNERLDDGTLSLELKAKDLSVSYNKVVVSFDTKRNVPLKQEMYSLSGKLIKVMEYSYETLPDGSIFPSEVTIKDELMKNSLTKMYYKNCKRRHDKSAVFFTLGSLKQ